MISSFRLLFIAVLFTFLTNYAEAKVTSPFADIAIRSQTDTVPDVQMVGGDRDSHGCIPSAGYTWSVIQKDCIRLFESAIRLNPTTSKGSSIQSAFLIISKDKKKVELYVPERKTGSFILNRKVDKGSQTWQTGIYKVVLSKGVYQLSKNGKQTYSGSANS